MTLDISIFNYISLSTRCPTHLLRELIRIFTLIFFSLHNFHFSSAVFLPANDFLIHGIHCLNYSSTLALLHAVRTSTARANQYNPPFIIFHSDIFHFPLLRISSSLRFEVITINGLFTGEVIYTLQNFL